jgi:hypothetical protein
MASLNKSFFSVNLQENRLTSNYPSELYGRCDSAKNAILNLMVLLR